MNTESLIAEFLARGGKITECPIGATADNGESIARFNHGETMCRCGCHGDYTDHSMRAAESGRDPSIKVR